MPTSENLKIQCCMSIQKAFEKGASYAVSEESVFAMMTPILTGMRVQSASLVNQMDASDTVLPPTGSYAVGFQNMDKASPEEEGFFTKLQGNWFPEGQEVNAFFDSKCIPCGLRLDSAGQFVGAQFEAFGKSILAHWKAWLMSFMRQIQNLLSFFSLPDKYLDICSLIAFLKDFMCVPDLQRILSALMALMAKVSFEFGGLFDLILGLIAPLLQPFLSGLVDLLTKYIMLIIKPIECIINAIQDMIRKLDYNVLFQNIESLDKHIGVGRKTGPKIGTAGETTTQAIQGARKIPVVGPVVPDAQVSVDLHEGPGRAFEADFNMLGPVADWIKEDNAKKQAAVEQAADELAALERAGPDGSTPGELERYNQKVEEKKKNVQDAKDQRDLSALGRLNKNISETVQYLKSSMFELIGMLKDAVRGVEEFFNKLFDELKKIMGEFIGGSGGIAALLMQKMAIVQMIALIGSIIKFLGKMSCDEEEEDSIKAERFLNQQQGMKMWTDDMGNLHIEEDIEVMSKAINEAVRAIGSTPSVMGATSAPITGVSPSTGALADLGESGAAATESMQKLKSLIEFTGDPVLDTEIARTTEAMITPVKVTFKCPLQTSVSQTDQVNQWIQELEAE